MAMGSLVYVAIAADGSRGGYDGARGQPRPVGGLDAGPRAQRAGGASVRRAGERRHADATRREAPHLQYADAATAAPLVARLERGRDHGRDAEWSTGLRCPQRAGSSRT